MAINPGFTETQPAASVRSSTVIGESFTRLSHINTAFTLSTGTLTLTALWLPANASVGHLEMCSAAAGITGPTHWWFGLYDGSLNQLATTADQTSTAWAANTYQSQAIAQIASGSASSFTTTYSGLHYIGVVATWSGSGPSLMSVAQIATALGARAPILMGGSDTGQTTPPAFPHTATAITSASNPIYVAAAS